MHHVVCTPCPCDRCGAKCISVFQLHPAAMSAHYKRLLQEPKSAFPFRPQLYLLHGLYKEQSTGQHPFDAAPHRKFSTSPRPTQHPPISSPTRAPGTTSLQQMVACNHTRHLIYLETPRPSPCTSSTCDQAWVLFLASLRQPSHPLLRAVAPSAAFICRCRAAVTEW